MSSFATRLEGTLNQIWLKCPGWITNSKVSWHLRDHVFHGVYKHISDSIRYLYSSPETTYLQLMVQPIRQKVKWRRQKMKLRQGQLLPQRWLMVQKLSTQTAKLMAALMRAEQGNCPVSAPNSPGHRGHGRGWMDRNTPACPSSHNGWAGLGQTTSIYSSFASSRVSTVPQGKWSTQRWSGQCSEYERPQLTSVF